MKSLRTNRRSTRSTAAPEPLEARIAPAALIGLTNANELLSFDSATPGTVTTLAVSGLGAGESLIGIDHRPATGALYGLTMDAGNAGRLYVLNGTTGAANFVATLTADPADASAPYTGLSGANFGVDFNPVPDRLRVVSDLEQNLRINVDTGLVTTDGTLAFAVGDGNEGDNPMIVGSAYTNSFAGTTGTTLYGIDLETQNIVTQNPPNAGTLNTITDAVNATGVGGFDILSTRDAGGVVTNVGFAALTEGGVTALYTTDLVDPFVLVGTIGAGLTPLRGLTAPLGTPSGTAFAITSGGDLIRFNTATPNLLTTVGAVTGLIAGDEVVGLDFRPATGVLYALTADAGDAGRLYTIDTTTGAATLAGTLAADPADATSPYTGLLGTIYGVDFNPVPDRLRVVNDVGQNLRINVDTGLVTTDGNLNGADAQGVAYTNAFAGATTTTLYDIDEATDTLYTQNPPNNGTLVPVGALGVDVTGVVGFDIRTAGNLALATLEIGGGATGLFSINLTTGAATSVGTIGAGGALLGLALAPSGALQFSAPAFSVNEGTGTAAVTVSRVGGSEGTVSAVVNTSNLTATAGADYTATATVVTFLTGETTKTIAIPITQDAAVEGLEAFRVTLSNAAGGAGLNASSTTTVRIVGDEFNAIGLDAANNLVALNSATPGTIASTTAVTGLGAGETLVGIDFRPATGALYGLTIDAGNAGRLYTINATTGAASFSALLAADVADTTAPYTALDGASFGVDFNPVPDRLRVVSDTGRNLRINVDTGAVTTDADLNPAGANVAGVAYANSFAGAAATTLYDIDVEGDQLFQQNPPNNGTLVVTGALGVDATGVSGFDIFSTRLASGTVVDSALAALTVGGATGLYSIDLTTGAATSLGAIGAGTTGLVGLTTVIDTPSANAFTVNSTNQLIAFNVATPNVSTIVGAITGLDAGATIAGFDFRPADGQLYLLTNNAGIGKIYTVNTTTAVATLVSTLAADGADTSSPYTALAGTSFGVDFNPVPDRLRVVTSTGQNLRINVTTGATTTDTDLNPGTPSITGAAYANSFAGATTTTLYDIDSATDTLVIQNPPNNGTLASALPLGVNVNAVGGFDIRAAGNQAFAALDVGGQTQLYSIDLTTGLATPLGLIGSATSTLGLAIQPNGALQFASSSVTVAENGAATVDLTINRVGSSAGAVTVNVTTSNGTATAGSDFTAVTRTVSFANGQTSAVVSIPLTNDATSEDFESFRVTLSSATGGAVIAAAGTTVIISDDERPAANFFTTDGLNLSRGNTLAPATLATLPITGLNVGETIVGLDIRPDNALLYALGSTGRLFTLDTQTGAATAIGTGTLALTGTSFGFDFNPTTNATVGGNALRIVSNTGQNLRVNPNTGALLGTDPALAYAVGDANVGVAPQVSGAAYANNNPGTATTTLFDIDFGLDALVRQDPPNNGTLNTVGALGVDATAVLGFDIRPGSGAALATLVVGGNTGLYEINLTTGQASLIASVPTGTTSFALAPDGFTFTQTGGAPNTVTITGTDSGDTLKLTAAGGLLRHNRFAAGDLGFVSDADFDSTVAGVQSITVPATAADVVLNIATGNGSDAITVAGNLGITVNVDGGAPTTAPGDVLNIDRGFFLPTTVINPTSIETTNTLNVAPTLSIADVTLAEGNAGNTAATFTVTLSFASPFAVTVDVAATAGTALAPGDIILPGAPATITIPAGSLTGTFTVQVVGDTAPEGTETFAVALTNATNATIADGAATGTILDDDATFATNGKSATFTDVDGDLVTIKTSKGALSSANFTFEPRGSLGGLQLVELDLAGLQAANVSVTAKRTAAGGDSFVNIGYIDGSTVDLGTLAIDGDVGRFDLGDGDFLTAAVKKLTVQSIGRITDSQAGVANFDSSITGTASAITVKSDIASAARLFTNDIGTLTIGGSLLESAISAFGAIKKATIGGSLGGGLDFGSGSLVASGAIGAVTVKGSLLGGDGDFSGSIRSELGSVGNVTIGGDVISTTGAKSGLFAFTTLGSVSIAGSLRGTDLAVAKIIAGGNAVPTAKTAVAIKSVKIGGSAVRAEILAGHDEDAAAINADVQIGAVTVGGDWLASSISAGIDRGADLFFGSADDDLFGGAPAGIASKIASITIKGQAAGSADAAESFAFTAEQLGALKVGKAKFPLTIGSDDLQVGPYENLRAREQA